MMNRVQLIRFPLLALFVTLLLSATGCTATPLVEQPGVNLNHAVFITAPESDAILEVGERFRVTARINVRYPVGQIWVRLVDVNQPSARAMWTFDHPARSRSFLFAETIEIPADFNVTGSGDYRLSVDALPAEEGGLGLSQGYAIIVEVVE